ncbi:MAG: hypothetical protein SGILL_007250, partial [Bacillariaceae sp.]
KMMLKTVATFALGKGVTLKIARGSVLDFVAIPSKNDTGYKAVGAIVNAANEECLGGGGVDGAISHAGGSNLFRDRKALPLVPGTMGVRCQTGDAVITGPEDYGDLRVPYVIHAVGPSYFQFEHTQDDEEDFSVPDGLLRSAYQQSMERCKEKKITDVGFSLLSAGIFRGRQSMKNVLAIGVAGIRDWVESDDDCGAVKTVTLCGFSERETIMLMKVCKSVLLRDASAKGNSTGEQSNDGDAKPSQKRRRPLKTDEASTQEEGQSKPAASVAEDATMEDVPMDVVKSGRPEKKSEGTALTEQEIVLDTKTPEENLPTTETQDTDTTQQVI